MMHLSSFLLLISILLSRSVSAFAPLVRHLQATSSSDTSSSELSTLPLIWDQEQLDAFADAEGVILSFSTLGPAFRSVVRSKYNTSQILGYVEGFSRPGILHLDKMEVFRPMVKQARRDNPNFRGGGSVFGVGLLVGFACLLHGKQQGYQVAEFLAIDDEERQHKTLVRLYERTGFQIVKYVGDGLADVPDRLIWGGRGTLMRQDIDTLLEYWTQTLRNSSS